MSEINITPTSIKIAKYTTIAVAALVLAAACNPLKTVPTGHRGVITVGGAIKNIESEGFTLLWPWQTLNVFNVRAEAAQVEGAEGATKDTQPVHVTLTIRYNVLPDKVADVFEQYSKDGDLSSYVDTATREAFKGVTAQYTAPELIDKRAEVSMKIVEAVRAKLKIYNAQVISVDVTSFVFGKTYMDAINAKVTQDQLLQTAEKKALTVEAEQKQKVKIAEAESTALRVKADADAYQQLTMATAQARSLKIQNDALAQNKDVLELRRIEVEMEKAQRWNGALPTSLYSGAPIPFMSVK